MKYVTSNGSLKSGAIEDTDSTGNYGWIVDGWADLWTMTDDEVKSAMETAIDLGPFTAYDAEYDELGDPTFPRLTLSEFLVEADFDYALVAVIAIRDEQLDERFSELGYEAASEESYTDSDDAWESEDTHSSLDEDGRMNASVAFAEGWAKWYMETELQSVITAAEAADMSPK